MGVLDCVCYENREFQNVLAEVYANILDFHQRAYKLFRRRGTSTPSKSNNEMLILLSLAFDFYVSMERFLKSLRGYHRDLEEATRLYRH